MGTAPGSSANTRLTALSIIGNVLPSKRSTVTGP